MKKKQPKIEWWERDFDKRFKVVKSDMTGVETFKNGNYERADDIKSFIRKVVEKETKKAIINFIKNLVVYE